MSVTARSLTVEGGLVTGMAFGLRDVTEELRAKRELARSEEQFRMAMHGAPEGMAVADAHDRIVQANPALCELLGTSAERLIGHRFREFIPDEEREQVEDLRSELHLGELETVRLEHRLLSPLGEVWVDHAVGILRDEIGNPQLFVHQFADRTETLRMQADLTFRATHDIQTGLANRASLLTRLESRLGLEPAPADRIGVLWCDIDNLKQINDQLGHRVGDLVIGAVADRLKGAVRHKDIVGRIGGDEFVIVLDHCPDEETLLSVATNVQKAASGPVSTDIGMVKVTVSLGAVLAASTTDTDDALSRADHALYRAKRAGRDQVAIEPVEILDPLTVALGPHQRTPTGPRRPQSSSRPRAEATSSVASAHVALATPAPSRNRPETSVTVSRGHLPGTTRWARPDPDGPPAARGGPHRGLSTPLVGLLPGLRRRPQEGCSHGSPRLNRLPR